MTFFYFRTLPKILKYYSQYNFCNISSTFLPDNPSIIQAFVLLVAASHLVCGVPHPFAGPLKQNGKTCSLVRETTKVSEECFLEPECGEECKTVNERKCSTVQEQQCRTVQEQQCDVVQVRNLSYLSDLFYFCFAKDFRYKIKWKLFSFR